MFGKKIHKIESKEETKKNEIVIGITNNKASER
jgi:hypothetical protein